MMARSQARRLFRVGGGALVASAMTWSGAARAATAVVLPSMTPVADCTACPSLHRPDPEAER
ncbi:MAG TPA: hypothetical protein VHU80_06730, partial [Polyangiaceae bacterium]|nr:hypothetical protein [Polyangiaceae bacterium]